MKTNYISTKSLSVFSLIGLVGLLVTSCGSYQNTSYYDRDGIYNSSRNNDNRVATSASSQEYRNYFESRIEPINDSTEVFTDVDSYSSNYQNEADYNTGYASWGGNSDNITVNVYDNNWGWNNWGYAGWYGPGWGMGWNNWYGTSWGFGWGGWYGGGWGWNSWYGYPYGYGYGGWNNHYYHNNYAYSNGRRGQSYNDGRRNYLSRSETSTRGSRNYNNGTSVRRTNSTSVRNSNFTRNSNFNSTRNSGTRNNNFNSTRNTTRYNNSNAAPSRNNNSNAAPTRTSSPSRNNNYSPAPTRSSGSSGGGGGRSGGSSGGGGGRSSGGRR